MLLMAFKPLLQSSMVKQVIKTSLDIPLTRRSEPCFVPTQSFEKPPASQLEIRRIFHFFSQAIPCFFLSQGPIVLPLLQILCFVGTTQHPYSYRYLIALLLTLLQWANISRILAGKSGGTQPHLNLTEILKINM